MSSELTRRCYYALKPWLPKRFRYAIRRVDARRKRLRVSNSWPILPGSELPPLDWPGWPEGRQFAFVLTHDVEGQRGLDRCRQLMELEEQYGFRSSFNFVPEGEYQVKPAFRQEVARRGFEVGVHDLHHDGSLFRNYQQFSAQAVRINDYLKNWDAVGFRAGFMFHNLDWQHQLGIRYDLSTFDTDPFEPQPDGARTIFPFWVAKNGAAQGGFLELPYTLTQDSTLFLLLQEKSIEVWKRKLDWVAEHGGMALVNVHPDYVNFADSTGSAFDFPSAFYAELLDYVQRKYAGRYWHALPREVADYCVRFKPCRPSSPSRASKRVCMITHSIYEGDIRVSRYAEALAQRGDIVEVFALRAKPEDSREEVIRGVKVIRVQDRFVKQEQSRMSYLRRLLRFLLIASWHVSRRHLHSRYDFVHAHNLPDFVVFAAWLPKLAGARVILDVHDIVPELFTSKFRVSEKSLLVLALKWVERFSAAFANHVILANHLWVDRFVARSASREKCSVFINYVDGDVFRPASAKRSGDGHIIIFPGDLQWHQGIDIAIRAFGLLHQRLPQSEFHIYGDGHMKPELQRLTKHLGLNNSVRFFEPLPVRQIAEIMARADLGVVPKRADSFGNEAFSTKILEFMTLKVPVVISSTKIDRYYFNDSVARFFESGNENALAEAMYELLSNAQARLDMAARASAYVEKYNWKHRKQDYLSLVDSLFGAG